MLSGINAERRPGSRGIRRQHMPLVRLQAPVFEWNAPPMRVLEKIRFTREAVLRKSVFKDGQLIDSVLHAHIVGDG
jgi:RimJ/RimL family protein N-acetyltransferase